MRRSALAVSLFCLCTAGPSIEARAALIVTPIGNPAYTLTDFHLFSAPIGTAASNYAEAGDTEAALLPPPDHVPNPVLGIGPGAPHPGPYDTEFAKGVAANGFVDASSFTVPQYSNGNGVFLVFMLVPGSGAATGSSPDFASGPIIPNAIFPLTVNGNTLTNGLQNDTLGQFEVPAINMVPGFETLDGHSHIPFFFIDNFDFASDPVIGVYDYRLSIADVGGNGYSIDAIFDVPEPPTWMLTGAGVLGCGMTALIKRRQHRRA